MRTHALLTNHFTRLRTLTALLAAVALFGINVGPRTVVATSSEATTIVLSTTSALPLTGTSQTVSNFAADEIDAHVDCNLVSYTYDNFYEGLQGVHYFDLATNTDHAIPGNGLGRHSDVSGQRIAFIEGSASGAPVIIFDTVSQTRSVVAGLWNLLPGFGGNLVAFQQQTAPLTEGDIAVYSLNTGMITSLTDDDLFNWNPSVSPTGNAVVWSKCQIERSDCDIYSAIQTAPGVFTTHALTNTLTAGISTDTDGELAVYTSTRDGDTDIYYQPVAGGPETRLSIPGEQRGPNISGNLISFESETQAPGSWFDVFVYDIDTGKLYRVTNTANASETLSDISVCNGVARIVYSAPAADFDLYAFTFPVPGSLENQINDLIELVQSFNLSRGTENSLITKLQDALAAMNASDTATACSFVNAFINECEAQSDKKLTAAQATQLVNSGKQIKTDLNCL